jgi:hypothetical protein
MQFLRRLRQLRVGYVLLGLVGCSLALVFCGLHVSRAEIKADVSDEGARQVTVFGVLATPASKGVDTSLASFRVQLEQLIPKHGFRLLDAQSKRIGAGEAVACDLGRGYKVQTWLLKPIDENGKVQLRCELFKDDEQRYSTLVKTPANQLFFCQRALPDGSQLLIGVGAR